MKKFDKSTTPEIRNTKVTKTGLALLTAAALMLGGCTSNNTEQPESTPLATAETGDVQDMQIELPQMIESAQGYAIAPELAGLGGVSRSPLDVWLGTALNRNSGGGEVIEDGSRLFDLGWVALDPNEIESANFNGATAVDTFLNASENEHVYKTVLPEEVPFFNFDDDGNLSTDYRATSMDVDPLLQEQANEQLAQPVTPNNTEGYTIFSMTGVDVSGDCTIDFVVPTPITDFTMDFDSPGNTVYASLEEGETLWGKLGMDNMKLLDGTSYQDEYVEQFLQINPEIESVENIRPDQVFEVPFFLGAHNGG